MEQKIITIGYGNVKKVQIGGNLPLAFVGGPCAIENRDHSLFMAEAISKICDKLNISWIFKSCYDKDCRSSPKSFHGVGIDKGLKILSEVRDKFNILLFLIFQILHGLKPLVKYVIWFKFLHIYVVKLQFYEQQQKLVDQYYLKGQFMSPWNMKNSCHKLSHLGMIILFWQIEALLWVIICLLMI